MDEKSRLESLRRNDLEKEISESVQTYWKTIVALMPNNFYKENYISVALYEAENNHPSAKIIRMCSEYDDSYGVQDEIDFGENGRGQLNFIIDKKTNKLTKAPKTIDGNKYTDRLNKLAQELVNKKGSSILIRGYGKMVSDGEKWIRDGETNLLDDSTPKLTE